GVHLQQFSDNLIGGIIDRADLLFQRNDLDQELGDGHFAGSVIERVIDPVECDLQFADLRSHRASELQNFADERLVALVAVHVAQQRGKRGVIVPQLNNGGV